MLLKIFAKLQQSIFLNSTDIRAGNTEFFGDFPLRIFSSIVKSVPHDKDASLPGTEHFLQKLIQPFTVCLQTDLGEYVSLTAFHNIKQMNFISLFVCPDRLKIGRASCRERVYATV